MYAHASIRVGAPPPGRNRPRRRGGGYAGRRIRPSRHRQQRGFRGAREHYPERVLTACTLRLRRIRRRRQDWPLVCPICTTRRPYLRQARTSPASTSHRTGTQSAPSNSSRLWLSGDHSTPTASRVKPPHPSIPRRQPQRRGHTPCHQPSRSPAAVTPSLVSAQSRRGRSSQPTGWQHRPHSEGGLTYRLDPIRFPSRRDRWRPLCLEDTDGATPNRPSSRSVKWRAQHRYNMLSDDAGRPAKRQPAHSNRGPHQVWAVDPGTAVDDTRSLMGAGWLTRRMCVAPATYCLRRGRAPGNQRSARSTLLPSVHFG